MSWSATRERYPRLNCRLRRPEGMYTFTRWPSDHTRHFPCPAETALTTWMCWSMPTITNMLMNIGTAINNYSIAFIILLAVITVLFFYGTRTDSGRSMFRKLAYKLNFTRALYEEIAACRFASGMALTLSSGLNPERSMELVNSLNDDPVFQKKIDACQKQMDEGQDLSQALFTSGMFTGIYARMASIGSKTGSMDQVMDQIADLYQEDIDTRMNNLLAVLEPTLVILLSLIVGVILLSVMLPLMGIMSSI